MYYHGLFGLIVLIADVWAIVSVLQSSSERTRKVIWIVVVIVLPVLGFLVWALFGPRTMWR